MPGAVGSGLFPVGHLLNDLVQERQKLVRHPLRPEPSRRYAPHRAGPDGGEQPQPFHNLPGHGVVRLEEQGETSKTSARPDATSGGSSASSPVLSSRTPVSVMTWPPACSLTARAISASDGESERRDMNAPAGR